MTNMRRGFTMIELVFVIVIIGILAAVALPRFTGISDDAHVSKMQAFVGTLNRTAGPSLWSGIQRNDAAAAGSVTATTYTNADGIVQYASIDTQVSDPNNAELESIPTEFAAESTAGTISLATCAAAGTVPAVNVGTIATSVAIAGKNYVLGCIDSDLSASPKFFLTDGTAVITQ